MNIKELCDVLISNDDPFFDKEWLKKNFLKISKEEIRINRENILKRILNGKSNL